MTDQQIHTGTKAGTLSGTIISFARSVGPSDLIRTIVLETVGSIVSFTISLLLKWFARAWRKHITPK